RRQSPPRRRGQRPDACWHASGWCRTGQFSWLVHLIQYRLEGYPTSCYTTSVDGVHWGRAQGGGNRRQGPAMSDLKSLTPLNRPPLLHVTVQESLKQYIEDNRLKAGDPLPPETFLAQQLGVGRNSMREAIKALESLGIVETRRGVGVFVKEFSFK